MIEKNQTQCNILKYWFTFSNTILANKNTSLRLHKPKACQKGCQSWKAMVVFGNEDIVIWGQGNYMYPKPKTQIDEHVSCC